MLHWTDPLSFIHGLTAQQRRVLKTLDVETVGDLLNIFPRRYDDYSRLMPISRVPIGIPVTIKGKIEDIRKVPTFRQKFAIFRATVSDESGSIGVTWFNQPWILKQLKQGDEIFISGTVTQRPRFGRGFTSPLWEPATAETLAAGNVAPVYPLAGSLTQKTLRKVIKAALDEIEFPDDPLPEDIRKRTELPSLSEAYRYIHRPETSEEAERGRRRFAFAELLAYQLALRMARVEADVAGAPQIKFDEVFAKHFVSQLPFELTADQKRAVWGSVKDMESGRPMRRLLQGDVGSGKTVVAAMLCAITYRSDQSAVLMAPTDVLAKQHMETLRRFLVPHHVPVLLQTSSSRVLVEGGEEKVLNAEQARERVSRGRLVVVGTHAVLERGQSPPDTALAVVDEQHRFGVAQRETLVVSSRADGKVPHLLSMSATPIPRSLALTLLGDLDVSVISVRPSGRLPIKTEVCVGEAGRDRAYQMIRDEIVAGHRAFVICPLIDPSDELGARSVESEAKRLQAGPFRMQRVNHLHGKMPAKEKDERMQAFARGEADILVATTVVEVGVDVPEATVILIEGAERFGLAQLHQLRGRVGRSSYQSHCLLIPTDGSDATQRLRILERTNDGFVVAEEDLKMRGEGHLLGMQQSGQAIFKAARLDDLELMTKARDISSELVKSDPALQGYASLREQILNLRKTSHQE